MSVWPVIGFIIGGIALVSVLSLIFVGAKRLTQRLAKGRLQEPADSIGTGAGELFGEQGLISRGRGGDLYPRDENR